MVRLHVFSKGMQQVLGLPDKRIPVIQTIQNNSLTATRCRRDVPFDAMTNPLPREDAYMIFEWLDKAVTQQDAGLSEIASQPLFANFHDDPRWLPFLRKIGKAPEQLAAIKFDVKVPK
jgi:hypothetical protein